MSVLGGVSRRKTRGFKVSARGSRAGSRGGSRGERRPTPSTQFVAQVVLLTAPVWVVALSSVVGDLVRVPLGPDLVLAAAAAAAWTQPRRGAVLFALAAGILIDTLSGTPFGWVPARLAILTALFASLRDAVAAPPVGFMVVYLYALADRLLEAGALAVCQGLDPQPFVPRALLVALATAAVGPLALSVSSFLQREAGGSQP
ncbi:MAG: hypothetical protein R3F62_23995 [Planctomycetota bacterium]